MTPDTTHAETEWEKRFDDDFGTYDFYVFPSFVEQASGTTKNGMRVIGMALDKKDLKEFIREQVSLAHQAGKAEVVEEIQRWCASFKTENTQGAMVNTGQILMKLNTLTNTQKEGK